MNEHLDPTNSNYNSEELDIEKRLRPLSFDDFAGQDQVLENLKVFVAAANQRKEALHYTLFHGPPGLGKTTLANILANELQVGIKITSGPVLDKPGDLAGLLTNLEERDVLFIDEIHRLSPIVEEYLYSAMEDFKIDIMIEFWPECKDCSNQFESFYIDWSDNTLWSFRPHQCALVLVFHLVYNIIRLSCLLLLLSAVHRYLKCLLLWKPAIEIAGRSRGTPRIANALLRRVRDFAQIKGNGTIDIEIARFALKALNVDAHGLDEMDNKILTTIIDKFKGGPVGLTTLATAVSESSETIEEVYEPFLIQEGFIMRTPRGREVTEKAYQHLGKVRMNVQGGLF